jgi:predicted esterase
MAYWGTAVHWRDEITLKLPSQHDDEPRDLRQDILDEIEDHLDCAMQRELRHTDDARLARRRVLTSFGNPAKVARRLWLDAMKGQLMNQRIMLGTNVLLAAVTITMCIVVLLAVRDSTRNQETTIAQLKEAITELAHQRNLPPGRTGALPAANLIERDTVADAPSDLDSTDDLRTPWSERLAGLTDNWRVAFATGNELLRLPPDDGWAILRDNWNRIRHIGARQQILKAFAFSAMSEMHPHIINVMHLGMTDESTEVQGWAIAYLRWIAFEDFATDFGAYQQWRDRHDDKSAQETIIDSLNDWTGRLREGDAEARAILRESNMLALRDQPWLRETARQSDLPGVLAEIVEQGTARGATARRREDAQGAMSRIRELRPDEAFLRRVVLPIIMSDQPNENLLSDAYLALHGRHNAWARDIVLDRLTHAVTSRDRRLSTYIFTMAQTIASYSDPSVIPQLIALIDFDNSYNTIYGIGYFGLGSLTGVSYDESHDGAWWRSWWENNRERFPEDVRELDIPAINQKHDEQATDNDEQAGMRHAGGDENKAYFLIRADRNDTPDDGYKLLLILPGGDGSVDFHPFITRVHDHALDDDWIIAQLVAPVWDPQQPNMVVWPTRGMPWEGMKFSTEEFIDAVMADVMQRHPIDERHIYAMGWSSGGPPVYAATMRKETKLRGAFVAMSVFHPQQYPDPAGAKGRVFYLLHSPDDFIQMRFPDQAKRMLSEAGAIVELITYQGGHGWHGDVFGMIRRGIEWLAHRSAE